MKTTTKYVSVTIMKDEREKISKQKRGIQREIFQTSDFTTNSNVRVEEKQIKIKRRNKRTMNEFNIHSIFIKYKYHM